MLITGASGGIGSVAATRFAAAGATVVASNRTVDERLDEIVAGINSAGGTAEAVEIDITDEESVAAALDGLADRHGRLDVACNVAGVFTPPTPIVETSQQTWDTSLVVNLTATFLCLKHELRTMMATGSRGSIVTIASSIGVEMTRPSFAPYATSKAGVNVLTETAALEAAEHGIRVNAVSPGTVATSMSIRAGETPEDRDRRASALIPLNRVADPNEIVDVMMWLAGDRSSYVTGRDILVDGGQVLQH